MCGYQPQTTVNLIPGLLRATCQSVTLRIIDEMWQRAFSQPLHTRCHYHTITNLRAWKFLFSWGQREKMNWPGITFRSLPRPWLTALHVTFFFFLLQHLCFCAGEGSMLRKKKNKNNEKDLTHCTLAGASLLQSRQLTCGEFPRKSMGKPGWYRTLMMLRS